VARHEAQPAEIATATSLADPWTVAGTSYLYMGDRWANSMGGTVNDSQYVWLPLTFRNGSLNQQRTAPT
jgi:hypothetical protein